MSSLGIDTQQIAFGKYESNVAERVRQLDAIEFVSRFWSKDATLWGGDAKLQSDVASMLGWIDVLPKIEARVPEIEEFVADIQSSGFERVILAGMGGSSLAPLVFSLCYGVAEKGLPLHVLDSTDPATVLEIAKEGPLDKTLVVVASKSGTTAEPSAFDAYFYEAVGKPENFVAITDPGSPFTESAEKRSFRKIFLNYPDIGGRFSALSLFGLVPAALLGHSVPAILGRAQDLAAANQGSVADSPAFELGAALGELAKHGRDKITFLTTERYASLGLWMEQLLAESTGKQGTGVLPIAGEEIGGIDVYGADRVFVVFRPTDEDCSALDASVEPLKKIGHPVVTIDLEGPYAIAQEFFRFEIATAVIGAILDINPFDQPNVQESKDITKRLLNQVEAEGELPQGPVSLEEPPFRLYGDTCADTIEESLEIFLSGRQPGDYIAVMAYLPESEALNAELQGLQADLRNGARLATTMGYGPRFLHSTGQFHKGGPSNGYYLQLTGAHSEDAPIPGLRTSWGQFIDAQAMGDLEALRSKERRTLRIDIQGDLVEAIRELRRKATQALAATN